MGFFFQTLDKDTKKIKVNGKNIEKMYLSLTRKYEIHTRASKIEPKYEIFNGPQGTTRKLYKKKSRGKRSRMVLYRCRVAQSGANWLKLAKIG